MMIAMSVRLRSILAAAILLLPVATPARAADLVIYTEEYPPYNFTGKDGTVEGQSTAKVRQVMDRAGLAYTIAVVPWARALRHARSEENALIYSIARVPSREKKFDWLVPLAPSNFFLFARKEEMRPVTLEGLRKGRFTTACVFGDVTCDLLRGLGVPASQLTVLSDQGTNDFRLVIAGRADLYMSDKNANARLRKMQGFDISLTKPVFGLGSRAGFYLAAGERVPAGVRAKIRSAYQALVAEHRLAPADAAAPDDPKR